MSIRWRKTGELLCAAKCEEEEGDTYIDDRLHYQLSVELGVIEPNHDEKRTGHWHWCDKPSKRDIRQIWDAINQINSFLNR